MKKILILHLVILSSCDPYKGRYYKFRPEGNVAYLVKTHNNQDNNIPHSILKPRHNVLAYANARPEINNENNANQLLVSSLQESDKASISQPKEEKLHIEYSRQPEVLFQASDMKKIESKKVIIGMFDNREVALDIASSASTKLNAHFEIEQHDSLYAVVSKNKDRKTAYKIANSAITEGFFDTRVDQG